MKHANIIRTLMALTIVILSVAPAFSQSNSYRPKAYYTWKSAKKHSSTGNYAVRHTYEPASGWGYGFSVNEYFGDFEFFGDLIPFNQWVAADWKMFGQGIAYQMGFDVHVSYFDQINDYAFFRANLALGLLRGRHYSENRNVMSAMMTISDGVELYPAMDKSGFYFYLGGSLALSYQRPKLNDEFYNSVGLLPMANLGIGYRINLPNGGDMRIDLDYNCGLLDYPVVAGGTGKCAFNMSLDGYPGTYVPAAYQDASEEVIHHNFERGYDSQAMPESLWYQTIYDGDGNVDSKHFKWPDSYLKLSFTFRFGQSNKCRICRLYNF